MFCVAVCFFFLFQQHIHEFLSILQMDGHPASGRLIVANKRDTDIQILIVSTLPNEVVMSIIQIPSSKVERVPGEGIKVTCVTRQAHAKMKSHFDALGDSATEKRKFYVQFTHATDDNAFESGLWDCNLQYLQKI